MKKSKYQQYFYCFIVCILVSYAFWFSYQQNIVTISNKRRIQRCDAYLRLGTYQRKYGMQVCQATASSSHRKCSVRKGVLEISQNSLENICVRVNKVAGLRSSTLFKKIPWHRCFPVNFAKFLRTSFSQNTSGRLLNSKTKLTPLQPL